MIALHDFTPVYAVSVSGLSPSEGVAKADYFSDLDFEGVADALLPLMDFVGQAFYRVALARIGVKIFPFVRILTQAVELVSVFITKTKFPAVGGNDSTG